MDEKEISLNAEAILHKTFTPNVKGYDPDEVDSFLDLVLHDYQAFEKYYKESRRYIADLETQWRKDKEANKALTVENAKLKSRLSGVKEGTSVNSNDIHLVNRIAALEKALYQQGIDPRTIQ